MMKTSTYTLLIFDWEGTLMNLSAPFSGTEPVLKQLQAEGYLLSIATGKGRRDLEDDLKYYDLSSYFVAYRCGDDGFSKPHPEMIEYLLSITQTQRQQALMIGDTTADLYMAQAAQVDGLGVSYGLDRKETLLALNPRGCIDDIIDLPSWLVKNPPNTV